MSETTTEATAPEPSAPRESLSMETGEDATKPLGQEAAEQPAEHKPEPDAEADQQRSEKRREAERIARLTKARYQEQARANQAERQLAELQQRLQALEQPGQQRQITQADIDRLAQERAAQLVGEQQRQARINDWDKTGREIGGDRFSAACATVADMASDEQKRTLLHVAMDVDGGQRAIMQMAEDAALAERIIGLPPHKMALEMAKLGGENGDAKPANLAKPVSSAPPPIKPPAVGRAATSPDPNGSWEQYKKWSAQQHWRR